MPYEEDRRFNCHLDVCSDYVSVNGLERRPEQPSEDVKRLIERRDECHHWAGEEPYDKARTKQIEKAMADLRCDSMDRDVTALRRKYATDAAVQSALASAEE